MENGANDRAVIASLHAFQDRQSLGVAHPGRAQKHHPIDQLRIACRELNRHLAAQAAGNNVVGRPLDELIYVLVELIHQVFHSNWLARLDSPMQRIAFVGHQVGHVDFEEPAPEAGIAVPRLRLLSKAVDEDKRMPAAVLPGTNSIEEALEGGGHKRETPLRGS